MMNYIASWLLTDPDFDCLFVGKQDGRVIHKTLDFNALGERCEALAKGKGKFLKV